MKQSSKVGIIFKHEYMIKLKSRGFILSTILMPLGFLLIIGITALVTYLSIDDTNKRMAIFDESGICEEKLFEGNPDIYFKTKDDLKTLRAKVQMKEIDGLVYIDKDFFINGNAEIITSSGGAVGLVSSIERDLSRILKNARLNKYVSDPEIIKLLSSGVNLQKAKVDETGEETADHSEVLAAVGYIFGMLVYMMMLMYGAMVMRSAVEEKANRIVEILASSAKPMDIMLGKILAIGALGVTQLLVWSSVGLSVMNFGLPMFVGSMNNDNPALSSAMQSELGVSTNSIPQIDPMMIAGLIFFFIAGYFIYSTLFAAVGSAVDQEQDAQQLQTPLILPLIIPILFLTNIITNPDSGLAIGLSLFPFFAPILMPVRMAATNVPIWQLALCVALMVGTFLGALWVAGKIYRVGIMINGTQPKLKDLIRWIRLAK